MPHVSQRYLAWSVAPRMVSTRLPIDPEKMMATTSGALPGRSIGASGRSMTARPAIPAAPTTLATLPGTLIAPDVPMGTFRKEVIDRGMVPLRRPISVAKVSAVAAARHAAVAAIAEGRSNKTARDAKSTAGPPLATTWRHVREGDPDLDVESSDEVRKNATSRIPVHQPPIPTSAMPSTVAAMAPPRIEQPFVPRDDDDQPGEDGSHQDADNWEV